MSRIDNGIGITIIIIFFFAISIRRPYPAYTLGAEQSLIR